MNSASCAGEVGLAGAGGADEEEDADWAARVLEAGAGAANGAGDGLHGFVLADDAAAEVLFHLEQAGALFAGDAGDGNAGPHGDDFGDVFLGDDGRSDAVLAVTPFAHLVDLLLEFDLAVAQLGSVFVLLRIDGLVLFLAKALEARAWPL